MKPAELRTIFLEYFPVDENGWSKLVSMEELVKISPEFKTKNGCQWARTGTTWNGKKYNIYREHMNGRVSSIQLQGFETKSENHNIPDYIRKKLKNSRCAILDIGINIEIDHKDGQYKSDCKDIKDFQPLSKAANDAKRQHCKNCKNTNKRYDAKRMGYKISWIKGNENRSSGCIGCYWYDPIEFNREVSKNYGRNN